MLENTSIILILLFQIIFTKYQMNLPQKLISTLKLIINKRILIR